METIKKPNGAPPNPKPGGKSSFFTSKSGKRFYAVDYGYKCWPFDRSGKKPK